MLGKIRGIVDTIESNHLLVDVNGVGYLVHCSSKTLNQASIGAPITLLIETQVKEDCIVLYGFTSKDEKLCFLELTTVKGVGPRIALQILGVLTPDQVCFAINSQDKKVFAGISGVGPKIVERIFTELKGRAFVTSFVAVELDLPAEQQQAVRTLRDDAIDVLINLGVNKSAAFASVSQILSKCPQASLNEVIKQALSEMSVVK